MFSKRKEKRIHLIYYLLVFDRKTDRLLGHVVDITTGGIKLMCREPLAEEMEFQMKIILPAGDGANREVFFDARSVWCKPNVYTDFYGAGFTFVGFGPGDVGAIEKLIAEFGYR